MVRVSNSVEDDEILSVEVEISKRGIEDSVSIISYNSVLETCNSRNLDSEKSNVLCVIH